MSLGVLPKAQPRPPALNDPTKYVRFPGVPVFTKHLRKLVNPKTGEVRYTSVDDNQLKVICENTNRKVQKNDFPLVLLGHRDLSKPETEQPPVVGFLGRHEIGLYNGEPAILAEMFIKQEYSHEVDQYPRRSAETWGKELPTGYIDAVALLKRVPELDLGLITNHSREESGFEIFECQCEEKFNMPAKTKAENRGDELARDEEEGTENTPPMKDEPSEESNPEEPSENEDSSVDKKALETFAKSVAPHIADHMAKHPRHHKELARHLAPHLIEHFSNNADMHEAIGKSVSKHMSEDPSHHDGLIKRISDLLEDASEHGNEEREEAENGEEEGKEDHAAGGAGTPIAANTEVPGPVKDKGMENHSKDPNIMIGLLTVRLEKSEKLNKDLLEKVDRLETFAKQQQTEATTAKRRLRLQSLVDNDNIDIDVNEKLEQFSKFDDDTFETFAKDIERNYARRTPINEPLIRTAPLDGIPRKPVAALAEDELTPAEIRDGAIELFRKETNFKITGPQDGVELVKAYFAKADRSKYGVKK